MGIFDKMKKADDSGSGKYIIPGVHLLEINEFKAFDGYGGETVVCEFIVRESTPDTGAIEEQRRQREEGKGAYCHPRTNTYTPHNIGESVSTVYKDAGGLAGDMAMKNLKALFNCLTGGRADDMDADDFEAFTGPAQLARGAILRCTGFDKATKSGDKMITNFKWELVEPSPAMSNAAE